MNDAKQKEIYTVTFLPVGTNPTSQKEMTLEYDYFDGVFEDVENICLVRGMKAKLLQHGKVVAICTSHGRVSVLKAGHSC